MLLKVNCDTHYDFLRGKAKAKYLLGIGLGLLLLSNALETYEKIILFTASNNETEESLGITPLTLFNRTLFLLTDVPLITLQWIYYITFIKLKLSSLKAASDDDTFILPLR